MAGMKFAKLIQEPCHINTAAATACDRDGDGLPDPPGPPTDERCKDSAFRKANPTLCDNYPVLSIKPATVSICALRSQKFRAFLYANNTEVEITSGLLWMSSNQGIAQIGAISGKATGVAEGIATISVTWQGQTAFSQVTVLPGDCCSDAKVGMVLVVDNSLSMTAAFNAMYATKLSFSKTLAYRFASELNVTKDVLALLTFNEAGNEILPLDNDVPALKTAITAITATNKSTNIGDALGDAIKILDEDTTLTRRVVVLFTDGWNNQGEDPVAIADAFEETGGIITVVGVRAFGDGFDLLNQIATGGFFLNAHSGSYKTVPDQMSGLKGYFCAGNCTPPGDVTINRAALMWGTAVGAFEKWDVVRGAVDLIGGTPPYELFDLLPGNGLYVDMAGSAPWPLPPDPSGVWNGRIESKEGFDFLGGTTYRLAFKMAGNQREATPAGMHYRVRVGIGDEIGTLLNEVVTIDDYAQDFTEYYFDFTGPGSGRIIFDLIEQADVAAFGLLLDEVRLIADPAGIAELRFSDDFDDENSVYIPPVCGPSFVAGAGYGYDCYGYGCLTTPLDVQTEDPLPQPDGLEGGSGVLGGGGGGGGSATSFDPAGIFPTMDQLDKYLPLAGGTMTGDLVLAAAPTEDLEAATKKYVDDLVVGGVAGVASVNGETGIVTLTTADIAELTNLYFTLARVLATALTGLNTGLTGDVEDTDTILQAFGRILNRLLVLEAMLVDADATFRVVAGRPFWKNPDSGLWHEEVPVLDEDGGMTKGLSDTGIVL